jgi:glycerol uptake facilitator-like aquaporin
MNPGLGKRAVAEGIGSAILLAIIVGSGIMGERLSVGNVGLALLANSVATGSGLAALILSLGPISGAHFNPLVSLSLAGIRQFPWPEVPAYLLAQFLGAIAGVWAAHLMFGAPLFQLSGKVRPGLALAWSEVVASFGLLLIILSSRHHRPADIPYAVAAYITSAYWFTASTAFANPAVTFARSLSDSFAGIRTADVPGFVAAQFFGAAAAVLLFCWLVPNASPTTARDETRGRS